MQSFQTKKNVQLDGAKMGNKQTIHSGFELKYIYIYIFGPTYMCTK